MRLACGKGVPRASRLREGGLQGAGGTHAPPRKAQAGRTRHPHGAGGTPSLHLALDGNRITLYIKGGRAGNDPFFR